MGWPAGKSRKQTEAASKPSPDATDDAVSVRLSHDFWLTDDDRRVAGDVIDIPHDIAADLVASGKASFAGDQ